MNLNGNNFSDTLVAFVNVAFICVLYLEEEKAYSACDNWLFESANCQFDSVTGFVGIFLSVDVCGS